MLPRRLRLHRSEDFRTVIRQGRKSRAGGIVLHVLLPEDGVSGAGPANPGVETRGPARTGLVVGRQVGNAVVRHSVSRRLRHIARDRIGECEPGTLIVIRALPEAAHRSSSSLGRDLDAALRVAMRPRRAGGSP